jgi:hypothetical protein
MPKLVQSVKKLVEFFGRVNAMALYGFVCVYVCVCVCACAPHTSPVRQYLSFVLFTQKSPGALYFIMYCPTFLTGFFAFY